MTDRIFESFLRRQREEGLALAAASDLLELHPLDGPPTQRYVARFLCKGLVRDGADEVQEANRFDVGIWFPGDYLRRADPFQVLTWLAPRRIFHPNISDQAPVVCIGRLSPGTTLVDILYQLFEVITFTNVTVREDDALNPIACAWAREHLDRFPVDPRPLKRRRLELEVQGLEVQAQ